MKKIKIKKEDVYIAMVTDGEATELDNGEVGVEELLESLLECGRADWTNGTSDYEVLTGPCDKEVPAMSN